MPGIKIVAPSNPSDAKGLMRAAIRDNNPVLFLEHMALYHAGRSEVQDDPNWLVPLGEASIVRAGADATVVASALMVRRAIAAAEVLARENIDVEVVDLRTISPLDERTVLESVRKTGRLVVACEAIKTGGSANEVVAVVAEHAFDFLKSPIRRVAPLPVPVPFHRDLEKAYLPDAGTIADSVRSLFAGHAD